MFIDERIKERLKVDHEPGAFAPDEFCRHIVEAVRPSMPYLARSGEAPIEIMSMLDYYTHSYSATWKNLNELDNLYGLYNCFEVEPCLNPGGSEGVYLDVSMHFGAYGKEESVVPLFTFKTLDEGSDAYAAMGALGGLITYAIELYLLMYF